MGNELDFVGLCKYVWSKRHFMFIVVACGVVLGGIIAFGIPKEYSSKVKLLPFQIKENKDDQNASMASMLGLTVNSYASTNFSTGLYSEILRNTSFLIDLADMKIKPSNLPSMTLFDYVVYNQKQAWWMKILDLPSLFSSSKDTLTVEPEKWDMFYLTPRQQLYISRLTHQIVTWEDKSSGLLNIEVVMQDPVVAAIVADAIVKKLQNTLLNIRRGKVEADLKYVENMYAEAKRAYELLEQQQSKLNDSQVETEVSLNLYNMIARQYEMLQVKVVDDRSMFSVLEPARVPVYFSKPNRLMIIFVFTFLALFVSVVWIILKRLFTE